MKKTHAHQRVETTKRASPERGEMPAGKKETSVGKDKSVDGNARSKVKVLANLAAKHLNARINQLFMKCDWDGARQLLEKERENDPSNHWVLTQLGVTLYEQKRYKQALELLLDSLKIVGDCPLTLWNLAGTLAALRKYDDAVGVYTWLLQSEKTPEDDPCWESRQWTDSLKADCVYRMGACFQNLGKKDQAGRWFREYLNLLAIGVDGLYSMEDVVQRIRSLQGSSRGRAPGGNAREMFDAAFRTLGITRHIGGGNRPPTFDKAELLARRRVAHKK